MFDYSNEKNDPIEALTKQVIGGQAVIKLLFRQALSCEASNIRNLELTYFAASVMTFTYLLVSKRKDTKDILDAFTLKVLQESILSSKEHITFPEVVKEYRQRYNEYGGLLNLLLDPSKSSGGSPSVTLLMHLFECVTHSSARDHMIQIAFASGLIIQYVSDHIDFVKTKLQ